MVLGRIAKLGIIAFLVLIVLVVAGFLTGILGVPSASVDDPGDWGTVSEEETEVITTIDISNPNPFGVTIGSGVDAEYAVAFNGVRLITGERDEVSIPSGDSTIELVSTVDNDRIVPWWREYVRAGETIDLEATGEVHVNAIVSQSLSLGPYEDTMLENEKPVIDAFDGAVSDVEGNYTRDVGPGTVGYQVRDASASWASVSNETTTMNVTFVIRNPGDVPVPLVADGFRLNATANGVALFTAQGDAISAESIQDGALLAPGEERSVTYTVELDNDRVDDWFLSHVERGERTELTVKPQLYFEVPRTGTEIAVPEDGTAGYTCQFQTGLLVDGQATETNCGSGGSVGT